ncbi:GerMN domain-containing protein [Clostridium sp. AL.422]|uniref:GerMN domain-containing protein n=1 Tax=Clostridium TaxID=1485 RepID=UPI00293DEA6A|nr:MULTISPECIES: GerMN domain-containing protein [unclassified Clostridium]MDV4151079.1 GerMN domain-containing protein [Clostridium sp. AL.422]
MKKKLFLLLFSLFFSIILIGCSKNKENTPPNNSNNPNIEDKNDESNNGNDKPQIENPSKTKKTVRLFYFDTEKYEMYYVDKEIEITDKAIIRALTKELQDYSPNKNFLNLTKEVEVTSAKLDEKEGILKVVFSSSYVDKMLLGSSTESGLLASLLSTYGYNLNTNKIAIYFEDTLYTSLRGDLPKGYFDVEYSSAIPYEEDSYTDDTNTSSSNIKNMNCRIYYYDITDDTFYFTNKIIEVTDSALVTSLTSEMKNLPNESFLKFGDNLSVKSAKLNGDTLTVDLSNSYYNLLKNFGSGTEISALKTLALTYAYNYGIEKVIILVDGKPYSGSHVIYENNEYVNIKVTNIKELR